MLAQVKQLTVSHGLAPARVARLRIVSWSRVSAALIEGSSRVAAAAKPQYDRQVDAIELELEAIFKLALSGEQEPDLQTFLSYADHLMFRRQPRPMSGSRRSAPSSHRRHHAGTRPAW